MNISAALGRGARILGEAGIDRARREASSLLCFVLQKETAFVIAHPEYELTAVELGVYTEALERRAGREPLQYITGRQEFFGLEFYVNSDVLIPRPETEILVESAIEILSGCDDPVFLEIGVGSGAISVAILASVVEASSVGIDISGRALLVAAKNARFHNVASRMLLREGDLFRGLEGAFDMIVSNPPYIPDLQLASLQAEVRQFEPRTALSGGDDGLSIITPIIAGSPELLKPGGFLFMEIGFDQAERVNALFDRSVWKTVDLIPDLQGIARIVKARLADAGARPV